jgi:hypothetical protein
VLSGFRKNAAFVLKARAWQLVNVVKAAKDSKSRTERRKNAAQILHADYQQLHDEKTRYHLANDADEYSPENLVGVVV